MSNDRDSGLGNWDTLVDRGGEGNPPSRSEPAPDLPEPPVLTLMACAWADLVGILAVCTGALIAILALGERPALPAFGWAAALGLVWWAFAAAVLIVVRQATPGMLLAGVSFAQPVQPRRVGWVLAAALVGVLTIGLSGVIGVRGAALRLAAASDVVDGPA
jgi:hypothetical protein